MALYFLAEVVEEKIALSYFADEHFISVIITSILVLFSLVLITDRGDQRNPEIIMLFTMGFFVYQLLQEFIHGIFSLDSIKYFNTVWDDFVQHFINTIIQFSIFYLIINILYPDINNREVVI